MQNNIKILKFSNDVKMKDVFISYKDEIFRSTFNSIKENHNIDEVCVVKIKTKSKEYSINVTKDKYIEKLNKCINYFITLEEYEICQECVNIINVIKK